MGAVKANNLNRNQSLSKEKIYIYIWEPMIWGKYAAVAIWDFFPRVPNPFSIGNVAPRHVNPF